jgi:hypothetical protein
LGHGCDIRRPPLGSPKARLTSVEDWSQSFEHASPGLSHGATPAALCTESCRLQGHGHVAGTRIGVSILDLGQMLPPRIQGKHLHIRMKMLDTTWKYLTLHLSVVAKFYCYKCGHH